MCQLLDYTFDKLPSTMRSPVGNALQMIAERYPTTARQIFEERICFEKNLPPVLPGLAHWEYFHPLTDEDQVELMITNSYARQSTQA